MPPSPSRLTDVNPGTGAALVSYNDSPYVILKGGRLSQHHPFLYRLILTRFNRQIHGHRLAHKTSIKDLSGRIRTRERGRIQSAEQVCLGNVVQNLTTTGYEPRCFLYFQLNALLERR